MSPRLRRALALTVVGIASTLAACEEPPPPAAPGPRPVKLLEIGATGEVQTREYPGRIKAGQYSEMSFEVPGRVTEFVYKEGAEVERGAVLARLDPRDYQARFDSAKAKLEHARSERNRYKEMYEKDVMPYSEYEMRARAFEVAEAALEEAKKALEDTVLRAPFDGVMARKLVEQFENVLAKEPVLVMQNDDLLEIKVSVPERDLARSGGRRLDVDELNRRIRPRIVVSSIPDREFPASLEEVANVADPTTRTFEATFRFEKPEDASILGGMTAKVIFSIPRPVGSDSVWIPAKAVVSDDARNPMVWVVDRDSFLVHGQPVTLGELTGDRVAVTSGLEPGQTIAVSGVHQLRDGMTVRPYDR